MPELNLWQEFRLHYGEGRDKNTDKLYQFFVLGWKARERSGNPTPQTLNGKEAI